MAKKYIPFTFATNMSDDNKAKVLSVVEILNDQLGKIGFKFEHFDLGNVSNYENYVEITSKTRQRCYARVNMQGGKQVINLGDKRCYRQSAIIHEFGHTIGILHEHQRADRDNWVQILWNNVRDGQNNQSMQRYTKKFAHYTKDYNYRSVMHYSQYAFSKNRKPTIVSKKGNGNESGINTKFNHQDIRGMRLA